MSKVISFSISDRYLDKLRTLYPTLTDNLAAKQFLTDRLDGSLGNSLDDSLDGSLDDKLKTLIESELDGLLEGRLDAVMGKSLTSLFERMARLEERLDTKLDGRLDDMEPLLKREREASIDGTVETVNTSPLPNQETVETADTIEPVKVAIGPVPGDTVSIESVTGEGTVSNRQGLTNDQLSKKIGIPTSTIEKWKGKIREGKEITSTKYPKFFKQWTLNLADSLWYEV